MMKKIRNTHSIICNVADRMKDSLCLPTSRLTGYRAILVAALLGLTGCVGPGTRFATLSQLNTTSPASTSDQTAPTQDNLSLGNLRPETSGIDLAASVSNPVLPISDEGTDELSAEQTFQLSQPVDANSFVQQMTSNDAVGSGTERTDGPSAYYTEPTPTSKSNSYTDSESVYQLLDDLEPVNPINRVSDLPPSFDEQQPTTHQPYVARLFPQNGKPVPAPPAPGTRLPSPPTTSPPTPAGGVATPSQTPIQNPADLDPYANNSPYTAFQGPRVREADLIINGFPARTGRIMLGGAVNSDAGIMGQLTVDERNFDITRWPTSFQDMFSGTAFRGAGQTFRLEAAPGSVFKRYTLQFADPNLLGYMPISMSVSGFLFDRRFDDWDEERLGGRLSFGYRITPDLSISAGVTGQNVDITDPRIGGEPKLDSVLGDNGLWSGEVSLKHDTRNTPIQASEGHYFEFSFEEVFGDYEYSRFELEARQYWLLNERADGSGRQTLSYSTRLGFSGKDTPIFENFFAGGYATMRGFDFRGASPLGATGVEVGGRFQWLNTLEYMFPLTADDAFAAVAFVDFGTVEESIEINADRFRVAPGMGLRVAIPMLGPAPLAFDFAVPVAKADTDQERIFSFYMSMVR